jgi:eukaryotic-like serine/threonine-protein kinase
VGALILLILAATFLPNLLSGTDSTTNVEVPTVEGERLRRAERLLEQSRLQVGTVDRQADEDVPRGVVIEQSPAPGELQERGGDVDLVISTGPPRVEVPDIVGESFADARAELRDAGFDVNRFYSESDEEENLVLSSDPSAGVRAIEGRTVTLELSDGPELMPDVVGLSQDEAEAEISDLGIGVEVREDTSSSSAEGTVTQQFPAAGSDVDSGDTAIIFVAVEEEEPTPTPEPTPSEERTPTPRPTPTPTQSSPPPDSQPSVIPSEPGGGGGDGSGGGARVPGAAG